MKRNINIFLLVLSLIFLSVSSVIAHHFFVEKIDTNKFEIKWGHLPNRLGPYNPEMIKEVKAFNLRSKIIPVKRVNFQNKVILQSKEKISLIAVISTPKYYVVSLTPEGKKKYYKMTKEEAQKQNIQILDSFYSQQFAKSLFGFAKIITKPLGLKFEIVPLKNPFKLKDSEILPIKLLFKGKPLKGIVIETEGHREVGRTNEHGIAYIKVSKIKISGSNTKVILAKYRIPLKDTSKADYLAFTTVLTWE